MPPPPHCAQPQDAGEAAAVASQAACMAVALQEYLEANHMAATQALLQVGRASKQASPGLAAAHWFL